MKKTITILLIAASLYLIMSAYGVGQAIILFITIGVIPGTQMSLSPDSMLAIITLTGCATLGSMIYKHTFQYLIVRYYALRFYRRQTTRIARLTQRLDHWYQRVQSTPTKAATPEE